MFNPQIDSYSNIDDLKAQIINHLQTLLAFGDYHVQVFKEPLEKLISDLKKPNENTLKEQILELVYNTAHTCQPKQYPIYRPISALLFSCNSTTTNFMFKLNSQIQQASLRVENEENAFLKELKVRIAPRFIP